MRTGRTVRVCVERARVSVSDATGVCLCACLRVFVGQFIPRTEPHLNLNKFSQSTPRLPRFDARVKRILFISFFGYFERSTC